MRPIISAVLAAALVVFTATMAGAAPPVREPASPLDQTFDAGQVCQFPLHLESIGDDSGTITTFSDGRVLVTGRFFVRATNLSTDESIVVNASGPFVLRFPESGSTLFDVHGPFLWILFPADVGGPGLIATRGHVTAVADPDFVLTKFELSGTSENLCGVLAA